MISLIICHSPMSRVRRSLVKTSSPNFAPN